MFRTARTAARNINRTQVRTMAGGGVRGPPPGGYKGIEYVLRGVLFKEDWQFSYFMIGLWATIIWSVKTFVVPKMSKPAVEAAPAAASTAAGDVPSFIDNPDEWVKWAEAPGNLDKLVADLK